MAIESSLRGWLKDNIDAAGERVYFMTLPLEPTLPAITLHKISNVRTYAHSGDENLNDCVYQLSIWALDYASARAVADEIIIKMHLLNGTVGTVHVGGAFVVAERDDYDPERQLKHVPLDINIRYKDIAWR